MNFQRAVYAISLICCGVELYFIVMPLIVNLAKDKLEQFPKRLWLLEALITCDVIVTTAKGE